jgi:hypothetical protein
MKRTVVDKVIRLPIDVYYESVEQFNAFYKDVGGQELGKDANGYVCRIRSKETDDYRVVIFIKYDGQVSTSIPISVIVHEVFHCVCRIRDIMYNDPLTQEVTGSNEEDWAYLLGDIACKVVHVINSMNDTYIKKSKAKETNVLTNP